MMADLREQKRDAFGGVIPVVQCHRKIVTLTNRSIAKLLETGCQRPIQGIPFKL